MRKEVSNVSGSEMVILRWDGMFLSDVVVFAARK